MDYSQTPSEHEGSFLSERALLEGLKSRLILCVFCLSEQYDENEQLAVEDIAELCRFGFNLKIFVLDGSPVFQKVSLIPCVQVEVIDAPPRDFFDLKMRRLVRNLVAEGTNLIHIFETRWLGCFLPWLWNTQKLAIVVTENPDVKKLTRHWFQALFYRRIDAFLVPSLALKKKVSRLRPSLARQVKVLLPGLDFSIFNIERWHPEQLRARWNVQPETIVVGMIATRGYVSAQSTFIKAAASVLRQDQLAKNTLFVIVGFDGQANPNLLQMVSQFKLENQILLTSKTDSLPLVLAAIDIFVLPSSKEIFGLQAVEAMAMGKPIILSSGPTSEEWVGNSQSGLLIRPGDAFDLQRKLKTLLEDSETRIQMGFRAKQHAKAFYDRKIRTLKLLEIYERALRKRKI